MTEHLPKVTKIHVVTKEAVPEHHTQHAIQRRQRTSRTYEYVPKSPELAISTEDTAGNHEIARFYQKIAAGIDYLASRNLGEILTFCFRTIIVYWCSIPGV